MGEMQPSDWLMKKVLRSDWLVPLLTVLTTDVAHFTTHVRTCLAKNKVARLSFVDSKTRNIAIQLDLPQSYKRVCTFFVTRFTASQESSHNWDKIFKIVLFRKLNCTVIFREL